jgi:hypothetical protein
MWCVGLGYDLPININMNMTLDIQEINRHSTEHDQFRFCSLISARRSLVGALQRSHVTVVARRWPRDVTVVSELYLPRCGCGCPVITFPLGFVT